MPSPTPPPDFTSLDRDSVPAPLEMDTTIGMEQFRAEQAQQDRGYADTVRLDSASPAGGARADAPAGELLPDLVMPGAPLRPRPPSTPPRTAELGVAEAMVLCRRHNRVAPLPAAWDTLVAQLQARTGQAPPVPAGAQLGTASMLSQRMVMRDLLVWAAPRGLLPPLMALLEQLPESSWSHMEG